MKIRWLCLAVGPYFRVFVFSSCDERLVRFIVISSGSAVDTGYGYVYDYLFTAAVRITNENVGSAVIIRLVLLKDVHGFQSY